MILLLLQRKECLVYDASRNVGWKRTVINQLFKGGSGQHPCSHGLPCGFLAHSQLPRFLDSSEVGPERSDWQQSEREGRPIGRCATRPAHTRQQCWLSGRFLPNWPGCVRAPGRFLLGLIVLDALSHTSLPDWILWGIGVWILGAPAIVLLSEFLAWLDLDE